MSIKKRKLLFSQLLSPYNLFPYISYDVFRLISQNVYVCNKGINVKEGTYTHEIKVNVTLLCYY